MGDQQPGSFVLGATELGHGEIGEVAGVAVKTASTRPGRQTARPRRAALSAPIEAPYRDAASGEVAHRLDLFFDEFAEASDHHTIDAGPAHRQMTPAQLRSIRRRETAPDEFRGRQKALVEGGAADRLSPQDCRGQAVGHPPTSTARSHAKTRPRPACKRAPCC